MFSQLFIQLSQYFNNPLQPKDNTGKHFPLQRSRLQSFGPAAFFLQFCQMFKIRCLCVRM